MVAYAETGNLCCVLLRFSMEYRSLYKIPPNRRKLAITPLKFTGYEPMQISHLNMSNQLSEGRVKRTPCAQTLPLRMLSHRKKNIQAHLLQPLPNSPFTCTNLLIAIL
jgi:hypothetical protein